MEPQSPEPEMTHAAADTPGHGIPIHDPIEALLAATERLSTNVEALSANLTVQSRQSSRLRKIALAVALVLVLVGGVGWYAVSENHDTQVTACENANESREASRVLWNYVLDLAAANARPAGAQNLAAIKDWVNVLYRERDCTDLGREYKQPPPPTLKPTAAPE